MGRERACLLKEVFLKVKLGKRALRPRDPPRQPTREASAGEIDGAQQGEAVWAL